ncbi:MAG TPA: hypothetical protein VGQ58_10625 [Candidatus Limnocylindrales bacterium]|nr:hypothetical protein [Candidatus Limnocylindrales bacterium]
MSNGGSSRASWFVPIAVAVIGLISSPVWGPPICRAVGICDPGPTPGAATTPGPGPFPGGETSIFLSLTSGPVGSTVKVSGEGFGAGETVVISFHTTEVGRTTANGAGSFSGVEITVPEEFGVFAPNQFFVIANGQSTIKSARAPFTVSG